MKKRIKITLCVLCTLFLIPMVALAESGDEGIGTIYYVANDGNDENSGTSTDDAWQTLDKINSEHFSPGDSILFKRNDHWREHLIPQSGSTDGYVTYGAYGTGNKPLLLGSIELNDLNDWIYEGNDIWATTKLETLGEELFANPSFDKNADNWYLWYEGNANAYGSRDSSDYDSYPASYKIDCTSQGSEIYDIQLFSRVANISSGKVYKLEFRAKCTKPFTMDYIALIKDGSPWNYYYSNPTNSPNITAEWTTHTVYYKANTTATDARITFSLGGILPEDETFHIDSISFKECENENSYYDIGNIIFDNEQLCGVKKWNEEDLDTQGDFWYDKRNFVIKIYSIDNPASYYSDIECALTSHIIDESNKSYVIYENLELKYGGAHGIGGGNTHNIIVRNCDLSYIGGGELKGEGHLTRYGNGIEFWGNAHDNLVERCRIWEIYDSALTNQNSEPNVNQYNIRYQNNIIWNCEWSYEFWNHDENSFMYDISFVNNSCAYAGGGWGHSQRPDPWGLHIVNFANITDTGQIRIINNIFYESTDSCIRISPAYEGLENLDLDYNCWYQASGDMINFQGYVYTMSQFSMYQSEVLQDQNSVAENPLFADISQADLHLQDNSPAIDAALYFDSPEDDFDGNSRPQGLSHDIGAYELVFNTLPSVPGSATLLSPSGNIKEKTPTYAWNRVEDTTMYLLYVEGPSGTVIEQWYDADTITTGDTCSVTPDVQLQEGNYFWEIQARNDVGYGNWSTALQFSVAATEPSVPGTATLLSPSSRTKDKTPTYTWNAVEGVTMYQLYVEGPSDTVIDQWYDADTITSGDTCSVTPDVTLTKGKYSCEVRASNDNGYGDWSKTLLFKIIGN